MRLCWPLIALALLAAVPTALSLDALASTARMGETEARLLVRSVDGSVRVDAEPAILVAGASPNGPPGGYAPTPHTLVADHAWRGLDRVVEVVLRRPDPAMGVAVLIEDETRTGVWVEWPAQARETPLGTAGFAGALVLAAGLRRARSG